VTNFCGDGGASVAVAPLTNASAAVVSDMMQFILFILLAFDEIG
jgi:hypothetical protein